jgi:DNA-binding NtrC family response regulator
VIQNPGISDEASLLLKSNAWPGNIRELSNTIQKILIFNRGAPINTEDIAFAFGEKSQGVDMEVETMESEIRKWVRDAVKVARDNNLFESCMDRFAGIVINEVLNLTGGNRSRAAKLLGLSRPTLHSKIDKYNLTIETSVKKGSS